MQNPLYHNSNLCLYLVGDQLRLRALKQMRHILKERGRGGLRRIAARYRAVISGPLRILLQYPLHCPVPLTD